MLNITPLHQDKLDSDDQKIQQALIRIKMMLLVYHDAIYSWDFHQEADIIPDKLIAMMESIEQDLEKAMQAI